MLSGAVLICDLVRSSSLIDHTWIVDRATGPCDERQAAGRSHVLVVTGSRTSASRKPRCAGDFRRVAGFGALQPVAADAAYGRSAHGWVFLVGPGDHCRR